MQFFYPQHHSLQALLGRELCLTFKLVPVCYHDYNQPLHTCLLTDLEVSFYFLLYCFSRLRYGLLDGVFCSENGCGKKPIYS